MLYVSVTFNWEITNVKVIYGNCPSYTTNDSSHLTGPWLAIGVEKGISKMPWGFIIETERNH